MKKEIAKSIRGKLLNLSKRDNIVFQIVITRYIYERLLYRLSISDYKDKFYLKGGALLYAMEQELARPTLDIDFLGVKVKNDLANIKNIFTDVCSQKCESDGVIFDCNSIATEQIAEDAKYNGIRIAVVAHLDTIKQTMKMDVGFGDTVVPSAIQLSYPCFMDELPDVSVFAYSLESVVAEKFNAMIDRAEQNSRYKDFYDVYKILKNKRVDTAILTEAIISTFKNRETTFVDNHTIFTEDFVKNEVRTALWNSFLNKIKIKEKIEFAEVMEVITINLKPIYEKLK